jgi:hypothetical protein
MDMEATNQASNQSSRRQKWGPPVPTVPEAILAPSQPNAVAAAIAAGISAQITGQAKQVVSSEIISAEFEINDSPVRNSKPSSTERNSCSEMQHNYVLTLSSPLRLCIF